MSTVAGRPVGRASAGRREGVLHSAGFRLFGETLLTGVLVMLSLLPLVTLLAGLAVGVRHLRRHAAGEHDALAVLWRDLGVALRQLLLPGLACMLLLSWLVAEIVLFATGAVPGGAPAVVIAGAALLWVVLLLLRFVAVWQPGAKLRDALHEAARLGLTDPIGSVLLVLAAAMAVLFVWMYPPLVTIAGGLICLALLGVERRRQAIF